MKTDGGRRLGAIELLLALAVVLVWGTNFVVIESALDDFPPLVFAALRFGLAALPWVLFIPRPQVAWRYLAAVGLLLGVGQFGVLFIAMDRDISPGLAPVVIQVQVFFTIGLSVWLFGEPVNLRNGIGLALAALGLWIIARHVDATTTPKGLALVLVAALSWAGANVVVKAAARKHGAFSAPGLMVWSSLFATPPLVALAVAFEGSGRVLDSLAGAGAGAWAAALWQSLGNTLFGFGIWNWLLARHSATAVTSFALLVPAIGLVTAWLVLAEPLQAWKLWATALIVMGLAINLLGRDRPARVAQQALVVD